MDLDKLLQRGDRMVGQTIEWIRKSVPVSGHDIMTFSAGSGPHTLLMVHGGPGCPSRYLRDSHEGLVERGFRLVTWDQLGCGESACDGEPSLWRLDRFVEEVEAVRDGLDLGDVHILGQSWGGVLGLEYLLSHPGSVRTFIAANTAFDLPAMELGFRRRKQDLGEETCRMMARHEAMGTVGHPEYQAVVTLLMYRHMCRLAVWPDSLQWCMQNLGTQSFAAMFGPYFFQCTGNIRNWNRMDALASVAKPVLLITGEHDYIEPELATRARDLLPSAQLAFFEGCSHMPFFEAPEHYTDTVARFLRENARDFT
jgi:proline iminopeptidase